MTELRERMLSAERSVAAASGLDGAKARVLRGVRRRREARSARVTLAAVVVVGAAVVAASHLGVHRLISPAVEPTVKATVVDAPDMTTLDVGEMPNTPVPRRIWDEVDDRWAMAVWAPVNAAWKNSFALDYPLLLTAPDGRTWTAATVKDTVAPTILAWDPVTQTALVTSGATDAPQDANLGIISLNGGEDTFTPECLHGTPPANAERWAARVKSGYVVHDGCGEEFSTADGGVRTELTKSEQAALWDAKYPRSGIETVQMSDHDAQVGGTALGLDPSSCTILVRPRQSQVGSGCSYPDAFLLDDGHDPVLVTPLPGVEKQPSITKLCGAGTAFGTLSDDTVGVGAVQDPYVLPLVLNGAPATDCRDGRYTWYLAGGSLYFSVNVDQATRVIAINSIPEDVPDGAGVIDVAPGPNRDSWW